MCRFAVYMWEEILLQDIIISPKHSIIDQSKHSLERESPLNGDGFWIAWYKPVIQDTPAVFKDISPAWNNKNLHSLASVTSSHLFMAHIRDASHSMPVIFPNNHPFVYKNYSFMHNGYISDFEKIKKQIADSLEEEYFLQIHGNTDSEYFFALLLQNISKTVATNPSEILIHALKYTIDIIADFLGQHNISKEYMLNTIISDGNIIAWSRFHSQWINGLNSLYYRETNTSIIVSSEPLSDTDVWIQVPENHLFSIDTNKKISTYIM